MSFQVLIVEPHDLVRNEIRKVFNHHCSSKTSFISEARDACEALRIAKSLKPNFITLEISLPERAGLPLLRSLRDLLPHAHIVVITLNDDHAYREETAREGAFGFVSKLNLLAGLPQLLTQAARMTWPIPLKDLPRHAD